MLKKIEGYPYYASWPGAMISTHLLKLPLSQTYFHGFRGIQAIEVLLYILPEIQYFLGYKTEFFLPKWFQKYRSVL